jgi:succinate dehydrogenase/fumarate reductase flavoprotein subunit
MSVFGKRAGERAAEYAADQAGFREPSGAQVREIRTRLEGIRQREEGIRAIDVRNRIQALMWDNVLALRDESTLTDAIEQLEAIRADQLPRLALSRHTSTYNLEWMVALESECMVDVAEMIARAALTRQESRGAHYRADYPNEDNENWLRNLIIRREGGQMAIEAHPVALTKLTLDADTKSKTGAK